MKEKNERERERTWPLSDCVVSRTGQISSAIGEEDRVLRSALPPIPSHSCESILLEPHKVSWAMAVSVCPENPDI